MKQEKSVADRLREFREYSVAARSGRLSGSYDPVADEIGRWDLHTKSQRLLGCVERVLHAMTIQGLYAIRTPKLQVEAVSRRVSCTWAYFPMHKVRSVVRNYGIRLRPSTRVLLILGDDGSERSAENELRKLIAHHLGHVLCYLEKPSWIHACPDADRAAKRCGLKKFIDAFHYEPFPEASITAKLERRRVSE